MTDGKSWTDVLRWALGGWRVSILILLPGAVALELLHQHPVAVFGVAALSLVPLASLLGEATEELAGHVDDLRLARLAEPSGRPEVDPTQDSARFLTGDQLFGRVLAAWVFAIVAILPLAGGYATYAGLPSVGETMRALHAR